jgi:hypothetical protein
LSGGNKKYTKHNVDLETEYQTDEISTQVKIATLFTWS